MKTIKYSIPAIHCRHCVHTIVMELSELLGVQNVKADLDAKTVEIKYSDEIKEETLINALRDINYSPEIEK